MARRGEGPAESKEKPLIPNLWLYPSTMKYPKDWGRAMRKHEPTSCLECGAELIWSVPHGRYITWTEGDPPPCTDQHDYHHPANGRKSYRWQGAMNKPTHCNPGL